VARLTDHIDTRVTKALVKHGQRICAVAVSPREVDAGAELTVTIRASCPAGCDLGRQRVSIRSDCDTELAHAEATAFNGGGDVTSAVVLRAPLDVGEHIYRAVLAAHEEDGVLHEETSTEFSFATKAHAASVNVWGLPSAIAAAERFRLKVGIKCSAGCKLTGRQLSVFDHEGARVGIGRLLDDVWPGTSALYFAEIEAQAPLAPGEYKWQAKTPEWDSGVPQGAPHAAGSFTFRVNVVDPPDYEVTVVAFDTEKQAPVEGAHVLLHPYRSRTDATGVAKVKVVRGRYRLCVSGLNYIPYENEVDVAGDVTTRVELTVESEEQDDYR
jgi:hypothetical protein